MLPRLCLALLSLAPLVAPPAAHAEGLVALGLGRMFDNDALGDMEDRWYTGSYTVSQIRGSDWRGSLPGQPFDLLEFRVEANTIAPADLVSPDPTDRRYAGILSFGLHSQFDWQGIEANIGGDLVLVGPQTGISAFQDWAHKALGMPDAAAYADQIGNGVFPTISAEVGKSFALGPGMSIRPFAAVRAGDETFARIGGDLTLGHFGEGSVMLRDGATGQRYRAVAGDRVEGLSFVAGGDVAAMLNSAYLPAGGAAIMSDTRERLRMGVQWQGGSNAVFYGITWIGPQFDSQPEGQIVGSLNIQLQF